MAKAVSDVSAGLFVQTKDAIRNIFPVLALSVVVMTAMQVVVPDMAVLTTAKSVASILLAAVVIYATCLCVLSDGRDRGSHALSRILSGSASFFIVAWALPYVVIDLMTAILIPMMGENYVVIAIAVVVGGLLITHLLAKYGTVYPAVVDGGDLSLRAAVGRVQVDRVFWRLLGVMLFGMGAIVMMALVVPLVLILTGTGDGMISEPENNLVVNFLASCISFCMSVATAVVLCNAYRGFYADPSS